jgi:double-stranded uracil-DNA glycosylase
MIMLNTKLGLDPVIGASSRVLILGTMPGDESLRQQRYYSHGRNQLWDILARIYEEPVGAENTGAQCKRARSWGLYRCCRAPRVAAVTPKLPFRLDPSIHFF